MSQTPDRSSDSGSEYNWPIDLNLEQIHREKVLFENIPEEYIQGDDITVFFTVTNDGKINPDADRIGLTRVGVTNMKECLLYTPVQLTPSTDAGLDRHGTATFASNVLPDTKDEFYQFCYINEKNKCLGSSLPFQLNCSLTDADLLSNGKSDKGDRFITLPDQDEADLLIVSTQRILTEEKLRAENRQLLDLKRRLESEREELRAENRSLLDIKQRLESEEEQLRVKLEAFQMNGRRTADTEQEYQTLLAEHRSVSNELTVARLTQENLIQECEKMRLLSEKYQQDGLGHIERCRVLEATQGALIQETNQLRSQLAVTSQLTKDQATKIIDFERRLMQSNELVKTTTHRQTTLEHNSRDQILTLEKRLFSLDGENTQLKVEIQRLMEENEQLKIKSEAQQNAIDQARERTERDDAEHYEALDQIKVLQNRLTQMSGEQDSIAALKASLSMMEQRCVKHRNAELEAKKVAGEQKKTIEALQRDNEDFRARFASAEKEYITLYRDYAQLQRCNNVTIEPPKNLAAPIRKAPEGDELLDLLDESVPNNAAVKPNESEILDVPNHPTTRNEREQVPSCPLCYFEFPKHMKLEDRQQHVEQHFN